MAPRVLCTFVCLAPCTTMEEMLILSLEVGEEEACATIEWRRGGDETQGVGSGVAEGVGSTLVTSVVPIVEGEGIGGGKGGARDVGEVDTKAICQFGTDFAMIQQLFPNRTRHQIKLKFKIEERKHPLQVHDALLHRSKDRLHVMQVIKQLQNKAEPTSNQEANGDPMNTLQDRVDKIVEETGGGSLNEKVQQYDREAGDKDIKDFMDSKGEVDNQDYNQDKCLFEWDSGTYPQDVEEDTVWEI
ncbi:hypothetical protein Cni_G06430 [Canna indica]|uniref:Transcription factor TFIIIB component B'' Myb domain-containing protein n=1 Tax=Canna indica TaxID=4628 RepID=A0AAQ3JX12_9LILI|nr:hypothetical protein Cni_G06430 [Canna indica]